MTDLRPDSSRPTHAHAAASVLEQVYDALRELAAQRDRYAGGRPCALLAQPRRLHLQGVAPRFAAMQDGLQLLAMGQRQRRLPAHSRRLRERVRVVADKVTSTCHCRALLNNSHQ
jgi:hypothetical protein